MGRRSKSATQRSARDSHVRSQQQQQQHDDDSIGSALSLKDQFDILVPIKIPDRTRSNSGAAGADAQSDVSSITTDEHKKMLKYLMSAQGVRRTGLCNTPMALCCCTEMTSSNNNDNGIQAKKNRRKKHGLGPAVSVDKTCDISRSQYSLFDALSEEDDEDDDENLRSTATDDQATMDSPIKRKRSWRKSIRKKMPWMSKK